VLWDGDDFMINIPEIVQSQIKELMKSPEGTVSFNIHIDDLYTHDFMGGKICEIVMGEKILLLEIDNMKKTNYYYSTPGTGTRIAIIDLNDVPESEKMNWEIVWSPRFIGLMIRPLRDDDKPIIAEGKLSDTKLRVLNNHVLRLGNPEIDIMGFRIFQDGEYKMEPTALDYWKSTLKSVEILLSGSSDMGYIFEVVQSNYIISALVTGFEIYTKKRFLEIAEEGKEPDMDALVQKIKLTISSRQEMEANAKKHGRSLLEEIVHNKKIDFQNYAMCKAAFASAYNIQFDKLGYKSPELDKLNNIIKFRHRIIHVSPLLSITNQFEKPLKEPIFSNRAYAKSAMDVFNGFINFLHTATINLDISN